MKSRIAILSMLVVGMLTTTTGAGLAVSGFAGNDSASVAQYGKKTTGGQNVLGEEGDNAPNRGGNGGGNGGGVAGEEALQPTRQVEAGADDGDSGGQLPFTGFAAIPVLLGGVALLSTGLVLRRRTGDEN